MTDTISVIIPTADRPLKMLLEAMQSVENQSLQPSEIFVVDNGRSLVEEALLPWTVKLLRMPHGVGVSRARNLGAETATGEYLAFLDDDDLWDRNFLRNCLDALKAQNADCVYGRLDRIKNGEQALLEIPDIGNITEEKLLDKNQGTGGINFLVTRSAFWKAGGFDPQLRVSEDRALALELLLSGAKIIVEPKAIAIMRVHDHPRLRRKHAARLDFINKYRKKFGLAETLRRKFVIYVKIFKNLF